MNKLLSQSISLIALIVVAFLANQVAAGNPFAGPSAAFPNGNTAFPITTGSYMQTKGAGAPPASGGGLVIGGGFIANQNASFDKTVGIQGILTGKPISTTQNEPNSNLLFGAASNEVVVNTTGWTYVNGGLNTPVEPAPAGKLMPLCANNAGEIITCPGASPITP